ncbi:MAG: hypothetical protein GX946_01730 [Oligosphaeraceae bacterium]|nr:hypothetical protein [Oligosphaeraceae bacterium]
MRSCRFILLVLGLLLCQSCLRTEGNTRYFVLSPQAVSRQDLSVSVKLRRLNLPRYLKRWELLLINEDGELHINEFTQWGELLDEGIRRSLRYSLASNEMSRPENAKDTWQLDMDLCSFIGNVAGEFQVLADCRLEQGKVKKIFMLEFSVPFQVGKPEKLVRAHEEALRKIAEQIAAQIKMLTPENSDDCSLLPDQCVGQPLQ